MQEYKLGRLGNRFVVSWYEGGKRRRYRLDARSVKEAEAEALDVIRRETLDPVNTTVAELWDAYRVDLGDRPNGKTMLYTGKAILPHFGHLRPDQVDVGHSRSYVALRKQEGRKVGSIWTELGHLRQTFSWAVKHGLIDRAPFVELPSKPSPKDRWLTDAEIAKLMAVEAAPHIKLAIILLLTTAARVGAILDLTWDRVDLERGQINLRMDMVGPRKGRAVVPINNTARAALVSAKEAALTDYVIEWAGGPISKITKGFNKAASAAGLDDVTPHTLRHTAAVHMAASGVPMSKVSQYLGHSSIAVTERVYARYAPDHLTDAADALEFGQLKVVK